MKWSAWLPLDWTLFLIGINAVIILVATTHLRKSSSWIGRSSPPWILQANPWVIRGLIFMTGSISMYTASYLTSAYHLDGIAGSPKIVSGRLRHTIFQGQYPYDREKQSSSMRESIQIKTQHWMWPPWPGVVGVSCRAGLMVWK